MKSDAIGFEVDTSIAFAKIVKTRLSLLSSKYIQRKTKRNINDLTKIRNILEWILKLVGDLASKSATAETAGTISFLVSLSTHKPKKFDNFSIGRVSQIIDIYLFINLFD